VIDSAVAENLDGERKTVTVLFADIKGSTELMEDLDPEQASAIIDPALRLMIEAVQHYGGYVVQSTGDGIFSLFGAPVAHEDHPQRALLAALRMQQELNRYSDRTRAEGGLPIQVRVGVNAGDVVSRTIKTGDAHSEYAPIGHSISLASRMQALAPIGSIAATEQVRKLFEGYFVFKSLGPTKVKGISEPVTVYEVTGLGLLRTRLQRAAARGYTKFVGRQREIDAMKRAAEIAQAGHGQIVAVVAEPGVGKSRLFYEFKATSQSGWLVLEALSISHGKATAYLPLIDLLHAYFRIIPDDDARTRREKVAGKVTMLDRSLEEETLPYLLALLGVVEGVDPLAGMDEEIRRHRTQEAVKRILLRESLNQPLILIFEDLHWIDEETQGVLNLLAESVANAPVLLLANYRPEYTHRWGSKTYYTQLRLDPLGQAGAGEMLSALLGDGADLVPLKRIIIDKTEGNPLFMEELVEVLFEEGVLVRNGKVKVTRSLSQVKIPPTVQGILAARIDRLPPEAKELLQTLAVIGMEFPMSLVHEIVQQPHEQLDRLLGGLQTSEFIYEQPAAGDVEYTFKHALTHDVAYNSSLTERRKLLHERIGQAIEALYRERLEDHYQELARHYRSSNNTAKAVEYLRLAGQQAAQRGAYALALANLEPALRLIEQLPDGTARLRAELGLRLAQGMPVTALYGVGSIERLHTFERVCQLSEPLGDAPALFRGFLNMGFVHTHCFETRRALEMGRRCVKLAEQEPNREMLPTAYSMLGQALYRSGDLLQAASVCSDAMRGFVSAYQAAARLVPANPWAVTPVTLALIEQVLGRADKALELACEALRRARELKNVFSITAVTYTACVLRYQRREPEAARELVEALIPLAEEHGFRELLASGRALRAWAMIELGQTVQGAAELETAVTSKPRLFQIPKSLILAESYRHLGRAQETVAIIGEELAGIEQSGAHLEEAELYRLKGEAILMRDSSAADEAESCFRKAIEIAKGQSAKWWELRATSSLGRLLCDTGRPDEARTMLAEIYNWFTEGFDLPDLKEARALLDELSA
jgi:class 3 adenylate cyclase/tetratricopeptide (TPR) repeat protein